MEQRVYILSYGKSWRKIRLIVLKRDNWTCQTCGVTDEKLFVHHIKRLRFFSSVEEGHKLSNLKTLCVPCHANIHQN